MADVSKYALALLPFAELSPAACKAIAIALEEARDILIGWNLVPSQGSRIDAALRRLHRVAAEESFGTTTEELHDTARAIFLANDLYTISRTLPEVRQESMAQELKAILGGLLGEDSKDRTAYEMQSQFWVGALLAYSRLHPALLEGTGSRPDFVITIENVRLAVEVKRPATLKGAIRAINTAHAQIRATGIGGVVVIDLTDALGIRNLRISEAHAILGDSKPHDSAWAPFNSASDRLRSHIEAEGPARYDRLVGLVVYARYCVWHSPAASDLDFGLFLHGHIFEGVCGRIYDHFGIRMLARLVPGIEKLSGNPFVHSRR